MAVEKGRRRRDQRHADRSAPIAAGVGMADLAPDVGQHRAGEQFKRPGERQIEGRDGVGADQRHIEQERPDAKDRGHRENAEPQPGGEYQQQRPEQIELYPSAPKVFRRSKYLYSLTISFALKYKERYKWQS